MKNCAIIQHVFGSIGLLMLLMVSACQQQDLPCHEEGEEASLTILFKTAHARTASRGMEDLDDDGTISEWEEISDGRRMYRLAVFLMDGNTTAASAILEKGDNRFKENHTEAAVRFDNLDYSKTYQLIAVANYGDNGHLQNVDNIAAGKQLKSTTNNLCDKNSPYPLSLKKEIKLQPGANSVSGELVRTFARIRLSVRNQSEKDLTITKLKFADRFTQNAADLFAPGGTANVSPVVTATDAITPFVANTVISKMDNANNVNETTIFDSYMLESNGGSYNYTLGLKYSEGGKITYTVSNNAIYNPNMITDGGLYVIYCPNSNKYLYANGTSDVSAGSSYTSNGTLNQNYVWKFTKTSNSSFRIESMGVTGYYINALGIKNNTVPLTNSFNNDNYFTLSEYSGYNALTMKANTSPYYLSVNGNKAVGASSGSNRRMRLFAVESNTEAGAMTHEETIPIKTNDKETGEAAAISSIQRNDFINILVNVTYNQKNGELEFEVSDWSKVNGEITFD